MILTKSKVLINPLHIVEAVPLYSKPKQFNSKLESRTYWRWDGHKYVMSNQAIMEEVDFLKKKGFTSMQEYNEELNKDFKEELLGYTVTTVLKTEHEVSAEEFIEEEV